MKRRPHAPTTRCLPLAVLASVAAVFPPPATADDPLDGAIPKAIICGSPCRRIHYPGLSEGWTVTAVDDELGRPVSHSLSTESGSLSVDITGAVWGRFYVELRHSLQDGRVVDVRSRPLLLQSSMRANLMRELTSPIPMNVAGRTVAICRVGAGEYPIGIPKRRIDGSRYREHYLKSKQDTDASYETDDGTLRVRLTTDFYIAREEVSTDLWLLYREASGLSTSTWSDHPVRSPVKMVSFDEAVRFCDWLKQKLQEHGLSRFDVRLPTEIEWEIAARGASDSAFPGDAQESHVAHPELLSADEATFDRSPFDVLHLGGNLREWTWTRFDSDLPAKLLARANRHSSGTGALPVLDITPVRPEVLDTNELVPRPGRADKITVKGGSYADAQYPFNFDVAWRRESFQDQGNAKTGFRFVIVPYR